MNLYNKLPLFIIVKRTGIFIKGFQLFVLWGIPFAIAMCFVSPCIAEEISITSDQNKLYFGDVVSFTGPTPTIPPQYKVYVTVNRNFDVSNPNITITFLGGPGITFVKTLDCSVTQSDGNIFTGQIERPEVNMQIVLPGSTGTDRVEVKVQLVNGENYTIYDELLPFQAIDLPIITTLTPSSITAGSDDFALEVTGTNFVDGAKVLWNGEERATVFVSATKLSATILEADVIGSGTYTIKVENPTNIQSNEVEFVILESTTPVPTTPTPTFLTLPYTNPGVTIQQGWRYTEKLGLDPNDPYRHEGIDYINNWEPFEVLAAANGMAMQSSGGGYGDFVLIYHNEKDNEGRNYLTLYSHLGSIEDSIVYRDRYVVDYADWTPVIQGEKIGVAGATGAKDPSWIHLHFEVQRGGYAQNRVDPYDIYNTREYYPGGSDYSGCGSNALWQCDIVPPPLTVPKLITDKVGQIDSSSAVLKGHIENPEPGQTYTVCFRYEGGSTPKTKVGYTTVTSVKPSYEYTLMGLEPATTYNYRAVHADSQGVGDDEKHPIDADNFESFSTSTTSQINTARVPEELLEKIDNYIEENPNFYYYDENWGISKDQYKLMITTLAWSEGNKAGYQAHSSDSYDRWHKELPKSAEGFHFSRGLGPFQITLGDIASKGMYPDIGRPWSNWKTIEKLNSTYALNSTLYRHKNTEKITNPEDIKDLESLRLTMMDDWYGYQYSTLGGWKTKWSEVTGTNWDNVKNSNESGDFLNGYQTSWSDIKTRLMNNEKDNPWMSEDEAIKNIGTQKWIIQDEDNVVSATGTKVIIDDYLPTWRISSWKTEGIPLKCDYYYTFDERYGVEIWALAKDPRYIFTRTYTKDNPKDLITYYEFGAHSPDNSGLLLNNEPIIVEEEPEFSNVDVALIIDSSGSMTTTDPTNLRKEAAKLFIDLVDDEDKIAIVDFDDNIRVRQSLIGISGNKNALKTAVDKIDSSGNTNIGGGLRYGYNELNGVEADPTHNKAAILLTDGQHNTGTAPLSVVPDYKVKGWPIYTIALSSDADKQLLKQISDETDGQFYDAPESKALQDIYNKISLRIKGNSQVDVQTGQIREGQTVAGSVPIDTSVKAFNIILTWPGSDLDLVLYNPDGSPVVLNQSSLSGTDNPDITYIAQNTYEIYKIQHPQPGTWRYDIIGIDVQNQEDYTLTLSASTTIRLDAVTNKQDYSLGEDVQITAELSDEYGGISGAYVTANVTMPDLSHEIIQISAYDNGTYHGIFLNTTQKGHYSILVEAQKDDIIRQKQIEFEINVTLELLPIANFTSNTTLGQIPLSIQFIDTSTGENITSHLWSFGDSGTSTEINPVHVYTTPGLYNVTLTVTNDCGSDSITKTYTVTPSPPVPNFEGIPVSGKAPLNVSFTDTSTGTITTRFWDFGDGTTEWANATRTISHSYLIPGTYTVSLTVGNSGGEETLTRNAYIQVNPSGTTPFALFAASPMMGYAPLTVQFTDRSIGKPLKWQWDFGDGNTSSEQNPTHTYYSVGKYSPTLKVFNSGGSSTYSSLVWVRSPFVFSTITIPPTPTIPSFPTFTIPPTPTTRPTVPPQPGQPPIAFFKMNTSFGRAPLTVQFTDLSFNSPTNWTWDFGDGHTSTERNPVNTYTKSGTYTVSLTVKNAMGQSATSRPIYVR